MKLYYPISHYNRDFRGMVFPLLKPFIKGEDFNDKQRKNLYGVSEVDFEFTDFIEDADVIILTMAWNYYRRVAQLNKAFTLIASAQRYNKIVWSINAGDFGVKLPYFENLIVFRQGGYVSNNQTGHMGHPSFISDYLSKYQLKDIYLNIQYQSLPKVGFCGQADLSKWNALKEMLKQHVRNIKIGMGFSYMEPQKIVSTSYLRASLLKVLEISPEIDTRFIKRKQYRAGITKNKETHNSTTEFYTNILQSQYVLCVRGAGNFSVRFYETLMMGRIPLYIHTDGYLPLSDEIDWKAHVVWVDYKDRHRISEILLDFHQQLDQKSLRDLFRKNRKLWEEKLTLSGFFKMQKLKLKRNGEL